VREDAAALEAAAGGVGLWVEKMYGLFAVAVVVARFDGGFEEQVVLRTAGRE
jgi:hypothetical protein